MTAYIEQQGVTGAKARDCAKKAAIAADDGHTDPSLLAKHIVSSQCIAEREAFKTAVTAVTKCTGIASSPEDLNGIVENSTDPELFAAGIEAVIALHRAGKPIP